MATALSHRLPMERREFLKVAGSGVFFAIAMVSRPLASAIPASRKPNMVLCMADDQGWGDMAYNGHTVLKTPNFDAMAASALRFDRFYAAAPFCSPTRGSVMTGRHPNRFGCFKWGHTLRPQEITVAEALKNGGICHWPLREMASWFHRQSEPPQSRQQRFR